MLTFWHLLRNDITNRSISNNERPHKAIDYAIPSRMEAAFFAKEKKQG
jgi:hypothetical protein